MATLRDLLLAPEEDELARALAPFFLGGQRPEVVAQGVRSPASGLGPTAISPLQPRYDIVGRYMGGQSLPWVAGYAMEAGADPETAHKLDSLAGIAGMAMMAKAAKGTASNSALAGNYAPARIRPGLSLEENAALKENQLSKGQSLGDLLQYGTRKTGRIREQARKAVGGLANTSKLECQAWGIPASMCGVGGRLRPIEGSVCHDCYAQGTTGSGKFKLSMYGQENVKKANLNRFEAFNANPEAWTRNMSTVVQAMPRFRWFDSGDLQGTRMLDAIVNVAKNTPGTQHWLPTKERPIVDRWLREHPEGFPENLQVRISLPMKEQLPENYKRLGVLPSANLPVAGVTSDPKKATCPGGGGRGCAPKGEEPCRDCFTAKDVVYLSH